MSESNVDEQLVKQVRKGDKEAFDILVLKYQEKINNVVRQYLSDPSLSMDVTQETFINAYRSLDKFQGRSSFYTWLYRIAVNTAKNYLQGRERRPPDVDIDFKEVVILGKQRLEDNASPEGLLRQDEVQHAVLKAVNHLSDELRTSIVLREMGGLSYREISVVMKCPVGTVRSRIYRARVVVDDYLKDH